MRKAMIIGGPGSMSATAIPVLLERGLKVAVFTLPESPTLGLENQVTFYRGDRNRPDDLRRAIDDFRPDAVIDYVCFKPDQAQALADVLDGRVNHFVFISTIDACGYPLSCLPMRPDDPLRAPIGQYAQDKRRCEELLWEHHAAGRLPVTVCRPTYNFSNGFVLSFLSPAGGRHWVPRLRAGRPILVPGMGTEFLHASAAVNTGRMFGHILADERAIGKTYTGGHELAMTRDDYVRLVARAAGGPEPVLVHVPDEVLLAVPAMREAWLWHNVTRFSLAFSMESFKTDFPQFRWETPLDDAMSEYVRFHDQTGDFAPLDEEILDDRIVRAWQKHTASFTKV